jgi:hypothetical protein
MFKIFSTYICWISKKMQHLEVSGAVQPLKWPLGVKWLIEFILNLNCSLVNNIIIYKVLVYSKVYHFFEKSLERKYISSDIAL